jgi:hypothetical protein
VIRPSGELICFQKAYKPFWPFIATSHLYVFPSSMFLRRSFVEHNELFDPRFRDAGDGEFVMRLLRKGYNLHTTRRYLSVFTITGNNRGQAASARAEDKLIVTSSPAWVYRLRFPLNFARRLLKLASGGYFERPPLRYSIYVPGSDAARVPFEARRLSPIWRLV